MWPAGRMIENWVVTNNIRASLNVTTPMSLLLLSSKMMNMEHPTLQKIGASDYEHGLQETQPLFISGQS